FLHFSPLLAFVTLPRPPRSTRFPYTTLFRSLLSDEWIFHGGTCNCRCIISKMDSLLMAAILNMGWDFSHCDVCRTCNRLVLKCRDRKSTRLNSSHVSISYAVFCLKKKRIVV